MPESGAFRVLIVEDSPTMRAVCQRALENDGLICETAASGEEGLSRLEEALAEGQPFQGLLLDWLLPGLDGAEVLERIGEDRRFDPLAVMIFTERPDHRAYELATQRPNNDIQLKEDLTLLPYRMRKFLTTYSDIGGMGDWRARQLLKNRDNVSGTVLFVDDSPTVRAKYGELLSSNGYEVLLAGSMQEALERARRERPQLAIVDYFMPGGNGDELCRALLADDRTSDITVVMHSQRREVVEESLDAGAIDLIWKNDPVNIFLMRVASIMRTLRAARQAKDLDILFAATQALDIGVMSYADGAWQDFNDTMRRFVDDCGSLSVFDPASGPCLPRRIEDRHGRRRAFNIHAISVSAADRVVLIQDATAAVDQADALARARDEAFELAEAKSQFLANMSHEIRTPLNGVIGMLDLLRGTRLDAQQLHFLDAGLSSAEALLSVIGDILDFSKIDAGRLELEHAPFALPDLVEETVQMLAAKAADKGLEMICDVQPDVPLGVVGDANRLRQVLVNLLGNALKFTAEGEVVLRVSLQQRETDRLHVGFSVSDSGEGIDAAAQGQIFEAFRQADNSTTRRFGGTGLGLAISSQLTQMMGGELTVESAPGQGSTFAFTACFGALPEGEQPPAWTAADLQVLEGKQVLVIEDNATNRLYLRSLCEGWQMRVGEAADPQQARLALADGPDLMLLDHRMPGCDGLELLRELRTGSETETSGAPGAPPALLLTTMGEQIDERQAQALGVLESLVKPIRRRALFEALMRALGAADRRRATPLAAQVRADALPRLDGYRVLAVEDNLVNQEVIKGILRRAGAEVELAENGALALERLAAERFDVVLMDCEMPVMDGLSATRELRVRESAQPGVQPGGRPEGSGAEGAQAHQLVIALTAHAVPAERERCFGAGMDDYLSKPVRAGDLIRTILRHTGERPRAAGMAANSNPEGDGGQPMSGVDAASVATAASSGGDEAHPEPPVAGSGDSAPDPVLDTSVLDGLREAIGDIQLVVEAAVADLPRRLERLEQAAAAGDSDALGKGAHTLAGSLANLGARVAVERARELEQRAKAGRVDPDLVAGALSAARDAERALRRLLEREGHDDAE
jgi:CheY-like chemotaxis protein